MLNCVLDGKEDFKQEKFFEAVENFLKNNKNEIFYFYVVRLVRLLLLDKSFGDYLLSLYGKSLKENKFVKLIYNLKKRNNIDEDLEREV
jgi:hypothetical protein